MSYAVKEIFYTLQGEGANTGRPAVFCRFAGCNLWTGRETDRTTAACQFCDTDFFGTDGPGGGKFDTAYALASSINSHWPNDNRSKGKFVVLTGGEPLLQVDGSLVGALHAQDFEVAIETNGTLAAPSGIDWICVSPKAGAELIQRSGHELKLIYPQPEAPPSRYENLNFERFYLQPMDGPNQILNVQKTVQYCKDNPQWRLSLQTHKILGLP